MSFPKNFKPLILKRYTLREKQPIGYATIYLQRKINSLQLKRRRKSGENKQMSRINKKKKEQMIRRPQM